MRGGNSLLPISHRYTQHTCWRLALSAVAVIIYVLPGLPLLIQPAEQVGRTVGGGRMFPLAQGDPRSGARYLTRRLRAFVRPRSETGAQMACKPLMFFCRARETERERTFHLPLLFSSTLLSHRHQRMSREFLPSRRLWRCRSEGRSAACQRVFKF